MPKATVATLIVIAACGCLPPLEFGLVTRREFVPEHTEHHVKTVKVGETTVYLNDDRTVPDAWYVTISGINDQSGQFRMIEVDAATYNNVRIGEYYRVGAERSARDAEVPNQ